MHVFVQTPQSRIRLRRKSLLVISPDGTQTSIPLEETERLTLGSRVAITTCGLANLLSRGIPVAIISTSGRHLGAFEPPQPPRGLTRRLAHQASVDPAFRLAIASRLVAAKIQNARRALQRLNARRMTFDAPVLSQFKHLLREAERADSVESLLGIEGAAAARYFALWAAYFPPAFPFECRSTRPPLNPVNAVLSYTGALVHGEILSATLNRGLDSTTGCLHATTDDRHSLVLDLMEHYRPALIEPLTLRMFSLGILNHRHFKPHGKGTYLNESGRALLIEQYEDRLARQFIDVRSGSRTTLRACLQQAPLDFKLALGDPSRLTPFLMA